MPTPTGGLVAKLGWSTVIPAEAETTILETDTPLVACARNLVAKATPMTMRSDDGKVVEPLNSCALGDSFVIYYNLQSTIELVGAMKYHDVTNARRNGLKATWRNWRESKFARKLSSAGRGRAWFVRGLSQVLFMCTRIRRMRALVSEWNLPPQVSYEEFMSILFSSAAWTAEEKTALLPSARRKPSNDGTLTIANQKLVAENTKLRDQLHAHEERIRQFEQKTDALTAKLEACEAETENMRRLVRKLKKNKRAQSDKRRAKKRRLVRVVDLLV